MNVCVRSNRIESLPSTKTMGDESKPVTILLKSVMAVQKNGVFVARYLFLEIWQRRTRTGHTNHANQSGKKSFFEAQSNRLALLDSSVLVVDVARVAAAEAFGYLGDKKWRRKLLQNSSSSSAIDLDKSHWQPRSRQLSDLWATSSRTSGPTSTSVLVPVSLRPFLSTNWSQRRSWNGKLINICRTETICYFCSLQLVLMLVDQYSSDAFCRTNGTFHCPVLVSPRPFTPRQRSFFRWKIFSSTST